MLHVLCKNPTGRILLSLGKTLFGQLPPVLVVYFPGFLIVIFTGYFYSYHDDHKFEHHKNRWPGKALNIHRETSVLLFFFQMNAVLCRPASPPQIWCECILNNGLTFSSAPSPNTERLSPAGMNSEKERGTITHKKSLNLENTWDEDEAACSILFKA